LEDVRSRIGNDLFSKVEGNLSELFNKMDKLNKEKIDNIWSRIIKNNIISSSVGKFDYVIGNPPWIRWGYMSQDYRNATLELWKKYGLFSLKGMMARLGSGEKDFSMLFLYACADNYLKVGGTLGFLITQEVIKSKGAGEGFRRFELGNTKTYLKVKEFHDFVTIQPFEGARNKTALIVLQKGNQTSYPVPYFKLTKPSNVKIDPSMSYVQVMPLLSINQRSASPIQGYVGSWQDAPSQLDKAWKNIKGKSYYKAIRGASIDPYGVFYIKILKTMTKDLVMIENLPELGKKTEIQKNTSIIESKFVYPVVRGSDINRWKTSPEIFAIIVQDPHTRRGYDEDWLMLNFPKTYAYLHYFQSDLLKRQAFWKNFSKLLVSDNKIHTINAKYHRLSEKTDRDKKYIYQYSNEPFYTMFNISEGTFSKYRVVWPRMANDIHAAVISTAQTTVGIKEVIGTDTVSIMPFANENEAHFVCAILNSSIISYFIRSFSSGGRGFGAPSIIENINIPKFDISDTIHNEISELSMKVHKSAANDKQKEVLNSEKLISRLVADKLYKVEKKYVDLMT
jgi:hypothetical protein